MHNPALMTTGIDASMSGPDGAAPLALRGGHVRVGLEDAPLGTPMSNLARVEEAVRIVRQHGAEPASAAEMRQALGAMAGGA
jgi:uncharacterized protein (DUF849 family)